MPIASDEALRQLLSEVRVVAVLGAKDGPEEDAFRVPAYLQRQGYRVLPVNPKLRELLGEPAVASLAELSETPDLVDVFRASTHLPGHADEVLALRPRPRAVWLQLGIRHDEVARRLEAEGIAVVQDRCVMVDHRRLLGSPDRR